MIAIHGLCNHNYVSTFSWLIHTLYVHHVTPQVGLKKHVHICGAAKMAVSVLCVLLKT